MYFRRDRPDDVTSPRRDLRGQSAVMGVILIIGFTVVVGSTLAITGASMLQSGQESTEIQHAENEMAILASKIAEVGLGDAAIQQASFSSDDGEYEVREDTGTITIEHVNYTDGETEVIDEISLGAVVYENGDTEVAYQGGGVWTKTGDSASMVSPPEFHYRDGTLTLPAMNVVGDSQGSGSTDAVITPGADTRHIYPNASESYNDTSEPYENPVDNGTVRVTVESDYYRGWEQYFDQRTGGDIEVEEDKQTVSVDLITLGDIGETDLEEDDEINLRGLPEEGDPLDDFNFTIYEGEDSPGLQQLDWRLEVGGEEVVRMHGQGSGEVDVWVYDGNGDHIKTAEPFMAEDDHVKVNLTSDREMENGETLGDVFNDRLRELGTDVDFEIYDQGKKQRIDYDRSGVFIDYDGEARFITFLQVTENQVEVELT